MPIYETRKENNFNVGDRVVIINNGESYTTYASWIAAHVKDPSQLAKFCYGQTPEKGLVGVITCIAPHGCGHTDCAFIKTSRGCYLVGVSGLLRIHGVEFFEDAELFEDD